MLNLRPSLQTKALRVSCVSRRVAVSKVLSTATRVRKLMVDLLTEITVEKGRGRCSIARYGVGLCEVGGRLPLTNTE